MNKLKKALLVLSVGTGLGLGVSYAAWAVTPEACELYNQECQEGNLQSCRDYRKYHCDRLLPPPGYSTN
ncbi:hypothetical protein [Massilia sp. BJB1822]|uniref:hypothetical protein n=1 Tax=Massilia sp. BJB1822 TaxID=2744470 RepID=UPI001593F144|nr:hypothetical protein [Massilia sp. BJB1822]NVD98838.1 hypothetical protein [Massilia sp. BJB1822]